MEENRYIVKNDKGQNAGSLNIAELTAFLWGLRYWIALFGSAALILGYIYVKFQSPVYERKSQIMLVDERSGGSNEMTVLRDITGFQQTNTIDNEVFILRSPTLMTKVVNELGLNYRYYSYSVPRKILKSRMAKKLLDFRETLYYNDAPFEMQLDFDTHYPERELPGSLSFEFRVVDESTIEILDFTEYKSERTDVTESMTSGQKKIKYGSTLARSGYSLTIVKKEGKQMLPGDRFKATWSTPYAVGTAFSRNLTVAVEQGVIGKMAKTNVITMTLKDSKIARADDILNMITIKYMEETRLFKNRSVLSTIDFIDKRLESISGELGSVESSMRRYQQTNTLVNINAQSQLTLTSDMEYETQLTEIRLQLQILRMIKEDMEQMRPGEYDIIPSNIGLTDPGLNQVITAYNTLVAERNRLVANSSENNPRVRNVNIQLADGRNSIVMSVENLEKVYGIREREIQEVLSKSKSKMSDIPLRQFDLAQIERKQQIIEPLYLLLQQKREEAQISMYAVSDNVRVIEAAFGSPIPVSPKSIQIYLMALILGCCIPPGFIYLRGLIRTTVQTKEDIQRRLNVPILATLPKCTDSEEIISVHSRDVKSESFRMLRSNLKFLSGRVIQVSSSTPGEGKSFVAVNLAVSISHMGSRVLLVGLDLRKPVLQKNLPELKMERGRSVVSYLIGEIDSPADTITDGHTSYGIDVAFSGIVPPNPTELMSSDRVETLIKYYREHYDYVIVDSAPMMPVSDSILLNRFVDVTLYVIRSEVTEMKMLDEIAKLFYERQITSPNIVLNAVDLESDRLRYGYGYGRYGYSYGKGYGKCYGYGYGYGYGYSEKKS